MNKYLEGQIKIIALQNLQQELQTLELKGDIIPDIVYAIIEKQRLDYEEEVKEYILDNLTPEQETKLKEAHDKQYTGTNDKVSEDYEHWLEGLTLQELSDVLK